MPRREPGQLQEGAGALVRCGGAALAVTEAGGGALWVGPALQGPAHVLQEWSSPKSSMWPYYLISFPLGCAEAVTVQSWCFY